MRGFCVRLPYRTKSAHPEWIYVYECLDGCGQGEDGGRAEEKGKIFFKKVFTRVKKCAMIEPSKKQGKKKKRQLYREICKIAQESQESIDKPGTFIHAFTKDKPEIRVKIFCSCIYTSK